MAIKKGVVIIDRDFSADWLPMLKESGIDTVGLHSLYQYGGVESYLNWLLDQKTQRLLADFERGGLTIEHQLHAVDWLLPRSLFKLYPDWFRVNDRGERVGDWNLCVSNDDALDFLANSAYKLALLLRQQSHDYYLWSDDCVNSICYCEKCRRYNGADQNMRIAHRILQGLKRYDAQARLSFLSYQDSLDLPTLRPHPDLFLEFAPIDRNHALPLTAADPANEKNRRILEALLRLFPAHTAQILEYFLDVSLFCRWKREDAGALRLDENRLRSDLTYYKGLGVGGITTFTGFMDTAWRARYGDGAVRLYGKLLNE